MTKTKSLKVANRIKPKNSVINWLKHSVWTFPLILTIILFGLTALKIHGSSIGIYHTALYGNETPDPDLIYNDPEKIRSDEWLGWTQFTQAQSENDFKTFNENFGSGRDVSKLAENPVKDWIAIFRVQNLSFFVLPLEFAFAFKWWFLSYLLIISCYFFVLRLFPGKKLFAVLMSSSFALSPFILWWYQSPLSLALAYGFFILLIGMRVISQEKIPKIKSKFLTNVLYAGALTFLGASTGLLLYPPYSIPIFIVVAGFLIGYSLQELYNKKLRVSQLVKRYSVFAISAVLVLMIGFLFVSQHREMIDRVSNTVYPGSRKTSSGELVLPSVFDGFLMPLLQGDKRGMNYHNNQSEAANFILLMPFLILPALALMAVEYRKKRKVDFRLLILILIGLMLLARAFVPIGDSFYKLLLLDLVPGRRFVVGMGFLGLILLLVFIKKLDQLKISTKTLLSFGLPLSAIYLVGLLLLGNKVSSQYPLFVNEFFIILFLAVWFVLIVLAFILNKKITGALLLLGFSIFSSYRIMPIYQELDFLEESAVIQKIQSVSSEDDSWITTDDLYYINLPAVAGRNNVGGNQSYPDLEYWKPLGNGKYEDIYNRQARAVFITTDPNMALFELVQSNYFQIKFECSSFVYDKADFVLGVYPIDLPCVKLIDTVSYPKENFYIYKITPQ